MLECVLHFMLGVSQRIPSDSEKQMSTSQSSIEVLSPKHLFFFFNSVGRLNASGVGLPFCGRYLYSISVVPCSIVKATGVLRQ